MNALTVTYRILYNNKDITRNISDHLISLSYIDKVSDETDELEITLDDKDDVWLNDWYPAKGATIYAEIIDNGIMLECGTFTIDEINPSCTRDAGNTITISCLAAAISKKLRTKKSTAHENKSLKQIAQFVAAQHGLTVQVNVPDIRFGRVTQNHESDLSFLNRIANQYGIIFSVRSNNLIYHSKSELESKNPVLSIDKTDISDYSFTDKNESTYKKAKVIYHNPVKNETIEHTEEADGDYTGGEDELVIKDKVENEQQARYLAKAQLSQKNTRQKTGSFSKQGNVLIVSGVNVEMTGFGQLSGIYNITESTHTISRDGYIVSAECKKVKTISTDKYRPKRKTGSATKPAAVSIGEAGVPAGIAAALLTGAEAN